MLGMVEQIRTLNLWQKVRCIFILLTGEIGSSGWSEGGKWGHG